jgi:hypothetical protein
VLARIRAERAQSLRSRATELFTDMRLLWPALGATTAVIIGFVGAVHVWSITTALRGPDSLAGILHTMGPPGSDNNPMRINPGMSIPRVMDEGRAFDQVSSGDAEFAFAAILTQAGRMARTEVLDHPGVPTVPQADVVEAVLDAFRESRYEPAQGPGGRRLAVMAVFYFTNTTVKESPAGLDFSRPAVRPAAPPPVEPRVRVPATPAGTRSALVPRSATA